MVASNKPYPAGLLLAGGQSKRFGAPKGEARLDGLTLNEIALRRLSSLCETVAISGAAGEMTARGNALLADPPELPHGPLSGILSGLEWAQASGANWLLVTPCDTPLVTPTDLARLGETVEQASARLAILIGADGPHPLCSVWSVDLVEPLRQALLSDHPAVWRFAEAYEAARCRVDDAKTLKNVNDREDLAAIKGLTEHFWWRDLD